MESFTRFWSGLQSSVVEGVKQQSLNEETLSLAHTMFSRIEIISERFLGLYEKSDAITAAFQQDLAVLFADLNINGQPSTSPSGELTFSHVIDILIERLSTAPLAAKASDASVTLPPYIQPAYAWLLENLYNPYPSKETKIAISNETGSSLKDIENWFINVRKRIGWNKLRLKYYSNKRTKIVDAATRFFKGISQTSHYGPYATHISGVDPTANHDSEFKSIEKRAKELYSDKLFETSSKINGVVRDLGPEAKVCAQAEEHPLQVAKSRNLQRLSAYPSPERSPERSPEPSPNSPLPMLDGIRTTSRKRLNSDRDSPELDTEYRHDEPKKRSRWFLSISTILKKF